MTNHHENTYGGSPEVFVCSKCGGAYDDKDIFTQHWEQCPGKEEDQGEKIQGLVSLAPKTLDRNEQEQDPDILDRSEADIPTALPVDLSTTVAPQVVTQMPGELGEELKRLKEEYKRQKENRRQLERERQLLQLETETRMEAGRRQLAHEREEMISDIQGRYAQILNASAEGLSGQQPSKSGILTPEQPTEGDHLAPEEFGEDGSDITGKESQKVPQTSLLKRETSTHPVESPKVSPPSPVSDDYRGLEDRSVDMIEGADDTMVAFETLPAPISEVPSVGFSEIQNVLHSILTRLGSLETTTPGSSEENEDISKKFIELENKILLIEDGMETLGSRSKRDERAYLRQFQDSLGRLEEKVSNIIEEVGFGESLDVGKIPPNIIKIVYEATLDDIVDEMKYQLGSSDTESIINKVLDEIRTRTSGSELFFYDDDRLKTRNLVESIENRLISAKQIQTTYGELLSKLLEYVPNYKAKNFRAMIKVKSQEYAVDKTMHLIRDVEQLQKEFSIVQSTIKKISKTVDSSHKELIGKLTSTQKDLTELTNSRIPLVDDLKNLNLKLISVDNSFRRLKDTTDELSRRIEKQSGPIEDELETSNGSIGHGEGLKEDIDTSIDEPDEEPFIDDLREPLDSGEVFISIKDETPSESVEDAPEPQQALIEDTVKPADKHDEGIVESPETITDRAPSQIEDEGLPPKEEGKYGEKSIQNKILEAISDKGETVKGILKFLDEIIEEDELEDHLQGMIDDGDITILKSGRWTKYHRT